jgi:hypothetical protein
LYISITAKATFAWRFADVDCRWVTVVSLFDSAIESRQLSEYRYNAWRLILHLVMLDEAAISADPVDRGNLRTCLKLIVQPPGHSFLPGVRPKLGFLEKLVRPCCENVELTPRRALLIGGLTVLSGFAKGLKLRILLPIVLFSLSSVPRL